MSVETEAVTTHTFINDTMNSSTSKQSRKKPKGRTFQCTGYSDCAMTFTRSEHLARHIRKHTGERPFECAHCSRKFSRLDNLRQHKQTVHAHDPGSSETHSAMKPHGSPLNQPFARHSMTLQQEYQHQHQHQHFQNRHSAPMQLQMHRLQQKPLPPIPPQQQSHHPQLLHPHQHLQQQQQSQQQQLQQKPHQQQAQPQEVIQPVGQDLPAAQTLLRPSQFRSKHRPSPLDLPAAKRSVYNDAPLTAPTPRSAGSSYFALSPITQSGFHQIPPASALPGVQFLAHGQTAHGDGLVSPYNSSFGNSVQSSNNTPTASTFDSMHTPTSLTFGSGHDYRSPMNGDRHSGSNRRSWLNNVLNNNYDSSTSPSSSISIPSPSHHLLVQNKENEHNDRKLRIESLLNSGDDKVKLPHVGSLGIDQYKQSI